MRHIETTRSKSDGFQTTNKCLVCGEKNFISDAADAKAKEANKKWFSNQHKECGEKFKKEVIEVAREKVAEILSSPRVASVECGFEYEADGVRYYTAITKETNIPHRYTVKFWEDADGFRVGKCNCAAGSKDILCRHLIRAAEEDTTRFGVPMQFDKVAGYRAHKKAA